MNSIVRIAVISTVVTTVTILGFVAWTRAGVRAPKGRSWVRSGLALLVATLVFGGSTLMLGRFTGFQSPVFAAIVTMVVLGWAAFANDLFPLRLAEGLRRLRSWEMRRFPYGTLGVRAFGHLLRTSPLRHLNPSVYLKARGAGPEPVYPQVVIAETVHWWGTALSLPYLVICLFQGWWPAAGVVVAVHIPVNVYPICHLRYVRGRLERVLGRRRGV